MTNKIKFACLSFITLLILALSSCDKYLDVTPKGYSLLTDVGDYDKWLNDPILATNFPSRLENFTDILDEGDIKLPISSTNYELLTYIWASQFSDDLNSAPYFWGTHYANINKYNTVLLGVDKAAGGTEQQKRALKAEALVGRAFEYFCLLNEYCKPYDATTAAQDPGVPFMTSIEVTQKVPGRGNVQQMYNQIIGDINTALPDLPTNNTLNRLRPDVAAAYSVLARIYFYARDYSNAAKNAQLALQNSKATMLDFNKLPTSAIPNSGFISTRVDVIFGRSITGFTGTIDIPFVRTYLPTDLRLQWYSTSDKYTNRSKTNFGYKLGYDFFAAKNFGTSVQEMKLIIAEVATRDNDLPKALQHLNEIRIFRFPTTPAYQPLQSNDRETVFNWVLQERKLEFPFNGIRWFDMRRLDKENRMPNLTRTLLDGTVIGTLPAHSPKYTLQIPVQVLQFNRDMEQNER